MKNELEVKNFSAESGAVFLQENWLKKNGRLIWFVGDWQKSEIAQITSENEDLLIAGCWELASLQDERIIGDFILYIVDGRKLSIFRQFCSQSEYEPSEILLKVNEASDTDARQLVLSEKADEVLFDLTREMTGKRADYYLFNMKWWDSEHEKFTDDYSQIVLCGNPQDEESVMVPWTDIQSETEICPRLWVEPTIVWEGDTTLRIDGNPENWLYTSLHNQNRELAMASWYPNEENLLAEVQDLVNLAERLNWSVVSNVQTSTIHINNVFQRHENLWESNIDWDDDIVAESENEQIDENENSQQDNPSSIRGMFENLDAWANNLETSARKELEVLQQLPSTSTASLSDELMKLAELHKAGVLSDDEFQSAKKRLLG